MEVITKIYIVSGIVLTNIACSPEKKEREKKMGVVKQWEVVNTDTVNRLDELGYKQGKWFLVDSSRLRTHGYESSIVDTAYYRNDTMITR